MHAPSVISLLVSALAASTAAGYELNAPGNAILSRRSVALMAAAAMVGPALALPAAVDVREPHHQGKGKGKKNGVRAMLEELLTREPHPQGKTKGKKNGRDVEEIDARDVEELEAREPHHQGKGKGKKNGRDVEELEARDEEVETREPHHQGKGKGKKNGRDIEEIEAREPHHQGKTKGKKNGN